MAQCRGKTKAGERCKRTTSEGSLYCSSHAGQASGKTPEPDAAEVVVETSEDRDALDTLLVAAAFGAAVVVVLAFGRLFRL